jgi:Domain of unknown function (DUF4397)
MHVKRGLAAAAATVVAVFGVGLAVASPATAAQASTSSVYVVHGIPGQNVDVYVNGKKTLSGFTPKSVAGPLSLPAGTYDVALTKPGDPVGSAILEDKTLAVPGGKNISLVAHLDADGKPALTAFVNDTSMIAAGKTRLVVRHVAAAPAVDVRAGGTPVFKDLTNPHQAMADIPAGTVKADVVLAGTSTVVLGPTSLKLAAGSETIVYAIGSASDKTLALVAQTMTGLGGAPGGMPAGSGGMAATGVGAWWYAIIAVGIVLLGAGALGGRRVIVARHRAS